MFVNRSLWVMTPSFPFAPQFIMQRRFGPAEIGQMPRPAGLSQSMAHRPQERHCPCRSLNSRLRVNEIPRRYMRESPRGRIERSSLVLPPGHCPTACWRIFSAHRLPSPQGRRSGHRSARHCQPQLRNSHHRHFRNSRRHHHQQHHLFSHDCLNSRLDLGISSQRPYLARNHGRWPSRFI